jgi:hypothetical protein
MMNKNPAILKHSLRERNSRRVHGKASSERTDPRDCWAWVRNLFVFLFLAALLPTSRSAMSNEARTTGSPAISSAGSASGTRATQPRVFLHDPMALLQVRARVAKGDPQLTKAAGMLRRLADQQLVEGPWSVMDKSAVPPSGDKHDYLSQAPYWWPDPNTPDGRPYILKDGRINPERDALDKIRFSKLCEAVTTLAAAYYFLGNEGYAARATMLLRVWFLNKETRMNPHLKYAQAIPGVAEGVSWGIIDTHTLVPVIDAIGMLEGSVSWTQKEQDGMRQWIQDYLEWLVASRNGRTECKAPNNHGTWYDVQVTVFALYCGKQNVAKDAAIRGQGRIADQIDPDGKQSRELQRTRSLHYTVFNVTALCELATAGRKVEVDLWHYQTADGRCIRGAIDWLAPYLNGTKAWSSPDVRPFVPDEVAPVLRMAANEFHCLDYERLLGSMKPPPSEMALMLLGLLQPAQVEMSAHSQ